MFLQEAKSILNQSDDKYLYHYFRDLETIKKILSGGGLKSIDNLPEDNPERTKYAGRDGIADPNEQFKHHYDTWYKDIVGKEYTTNGIYFTTVDLFGFPNKMICRIKMPIKYAMKYGPTTFDHGDQFGHKTFLVKTADEITRDSSKYPKDPKELEKLYFQKGKIYLFENLPQIAVWCKFIPITKNMIETR